MNGPIRKPDVVHVTIIGIFDTATHPLTSRPEKGLTSSKKPYVTMEDLGRVIEAHSGVSRKKQETERYFSMKLNLIL